MRYGVKALETLVQEKLRPVMRAARKRGLPVRAVIDGLHEELAVFNISAHGPRCESTIINLTLYIRRENHFAVHTVAMGDGVNIDANAALDNLENQLKTTPVFCESSPESNIDIRPRPFMRESEGLFELEISEFMLFFASRYLADGRTSLLFQARLRRGYTFQAYAESHSFQFSAKAFVSVYTQIRGKNFSHTHSVYDLKLRELRLQPIRRQLVPFKNSRLLDDNPPSGIEAVVLGQNALFRLVQNRAFLADESVARCMPRVETDYGSSPYNCFEVGKSSTDDPFTQRILAHFTTLRMNPGKQSIYLHDLLENYANLLNRFVYIPDLAIVNHQPGRLSLISSDSALLIENNKAPLLLTMPIEVRISESEYQILPEFVTAHFQPVHLSFSVWHRPAIVPEYAILKGNHFSFLNNT